MDIERAAVVACWQQLKLRFGWTMIDDESRFIDQTMAAIAAAEAPIAQATPARQIEIFLHRGYNVYLYEAFFGGARAPADSEAAASSEQACSELAALMRRCPALRGYSDSVRNDVIQGVFMHMLVAPDSVKSPGSLTAWVLWQVRAVLKALVSPPRLNKRPVASLGLDSVAALSIQDTTADLGQVETSLRNRELDRMLREILSPFQRDVVVLAMIEEQPDREVARLLNAKVTRVYVEKNRARQKLLASAPLRQFLASFDDDFVVPECRDG